MGDIILCIPTLRKFDLLEKCIQSAKNGTKKPLAYVIIDNSGGKMPTDNYANDDTVDILVPENNLGVAASWNTMLYYAMQKYPGAYVIIANDDIEFLPDTLEKFDQAMSSTNEVIYCTSGLHEANAFSLFGLKPKYTLDTVGSFDAGFYPGYMEDGDFNRRMNLLGYQLYRVPDCGCKHVGSATIKTYTEQERMIHDMQFRRNTLRYVLKHGGTPDGTEGFNKEMFDKPFGGSPALERVANELLTRVFGY